MKKHLLHKQNILDSNCPCDVSMKDYTVGVCSMGMINKKFIQKFGKALLGRHEFKERTLT
jgi:hypothetical protein